MNTDQKLDAILEKMDNVAQLLRASIPAHKLPAKLRKQVLSTLTPDNVRKDRMDEMMRIFRVATTETTPVKKYNQNYPVGIVESTGPGWEIMPRSILLNRAAQGRLFAPMWENDETTSMDNAKRTLSELEEVGKLVVASPSEGRRDVATKAMCVFSWDEAGKWGIIAERGLLGKVKPMEEVEGFEGREEEPAVVLPPVATPPIEKPFKKTLRAYPTKAVKELCEKCDDELAADGSCEGCRKDKEYAEKERAGWDAKKAEAVVPPTVVNTEEETFIKKKL